MEARIFKQANFTWKGGSSNDGGPDVADLPCWYNNETTLTLWRPTIRERLAILFTGRVWVWIRNGNDQLHPMDVFAIPVEPFHKEKPIKVGDA